MDRVQVTATRTGRAVGDVAATVDVIEREQLDRQLVHDIDDLVRYEPGISVTRSVARFGLGGFRIRGLDGNRVLIQTDGIAMPRSFAIGSFASANRDFTDLETLKRVEIVRGPASSLYGSDALGGVVAFVTKDPADYLGDGKHSHVGLKLGYDGDWQGLLGGVTAAFGGTRWSGMVNVNHRQGQETGNKGRVRSADNTRTAANPQERDGRSVLSKLVYAPDPDQRLRLTVEGNEDITDTDVLSAIDHATTTGMKAHDKQTRARVSFAHEMDALDAAFADSLRWQLYRQDSETTQVTDEARANRSRRHRVFDFDQRVHGAQAQFDKRLATGAAEHALTWGFDGTWTRIRQKRDGYQVLANGGTSSTILPDAFPVRDFPVSRTTELGLYLQDEVRLADGRLSLVPGVRVDHYRLEPQADAIFSGDNPGVALASLRKTSVSPKLGMVWRLDPRWSLFAGYARGFRSPPYNDVNLGFTNVMFGYTAIPNPDLKPETSNGLELGVRYVGPALWASLGGYRNDYRDFIESQRYVGTNAQGLMVFQSQNIADARIHGAELKAGVDLGELNPALAGWSLRGGLVVRPEPHREPAAGHGGPAARQPRAGLRPRRLGHAAGRQLRPPQGPGRQRRRVPPGRLRRARPDGALALRTGRHRPRRRVQPGRPPLHRMVRPGRDPGRLQQRGRPLQQPRPHALGQPVAGLVSGTGRLPRWSVTRPWTAFPPPPRNP